MMKRGGIWRAGWLTALCLMACPVTACVRSAPALIVTPGTHMTVYEDTLPDIAVRYDLGYTELLAANPGVDPWLPTPDVPLVLPTRHLLPSAPQHGIVINLADQRLYFFPKKGGPISYPVGIGTNEARLFTAQTRVVRKRVHPTWVPTKSMRALEPDLPVSVPPGPDNPLGDYALDLGVTAIRIHGTNKVYGIGRRVSHGCFRLYNDDIKALFAQVPVGTPVSIVNQPVKAAWVDGQLWLEVHPTTAQAAELEETHRISTAPDVVGVRGLVKRVAGDKAGTVDWEAVERLARERRGVPAPVTQSFKALVSAEFLKTSF